MKTKSHTQVILRALAESGIDLTYANLQSSRSGLDLRGKKDWTATPETRVEYAKIFRRLCNKYSIYRIGDCLEERAHELSRSTLRNYLAAMCFVTDEVAKMGIIKDLMAGHVAQIKHALEIGGLKRGLCGPSNRKKAITEAELTALEWWLNSQARRKNFHMAGLLLKATVIVGARPCEWETMSYLKDIDAIRVENGKATNERANGKFRIIFLGELDSLERRIILSAIAEKNQYLSQNTFRSLKKQVTIALIAANKALWPKRLKRITWYSARHQFAANAKACCKLARGSEGSGGSGQPNALSDPRAVASLLGHSTTETAVRNYARPCHAHKRHREIATNRTKVCFAIPAESSMAEVKISPKTEICTSTRQNNHELNQDDAPLGDQDNAATLKPST